MRFFVVDSGVVVGAICSLNPFSFQLGARVLVVAATLNALNTYVHNIVLCSVHLYLDTNDTLLCVCLRGELDFACRSRCGKCVCVCVCGYYKL